MSLSDEQTLAEAVGRLTEENRTLKIELANLKWTHSTAKAKAFGTALPLATAVALLACYPAWKTITATGRVQGCYLEPIGTLGGRAFLLKGDIDWREDVLYSQFDDITHAKALADKLNCPLDVKP